MAHSKMVARGLAALAVTGSATFAFAGPAHAEVPDQGGAPRDPGVVVPAEPAASSSVTVDAGVEPIQIGLGALGGLAIGGACAFALDARGRRRAAGVSPI